VWRGDEGEDDDSTLYIPQERARWMVGMFCVLGFDGREESAGAKRELPAMVV
jgi:hypothetical protein